MARALCTGCGAQLARKGVAGSSIVLKLKTSDFQILTRSRRLPAATQLAEALYQAALPLLKAECTGRRYRLIGVGAAELAPESEAAQPDLLARGDQRQVAVERVMDALRAKLGEDAIRKGRGLVASPGAGSPSPGSPRPCRGPARGPPPSSKTVDR